jgi:hypothetical protein
MSTTALRHDIPSPPLFMQKLPIDERGYPVPYFVQWIDGKPEFRIMDAKKLVLCVNERLCWICGGRLFREMVFVAGPMCAINRISSEPPSHRECARYAAMACPFLVKPHMIRRDDGLPEKQMAQGAILRNPGVVMLWFCYRYTAEKVNPGVVFDMGSPFQVEWYVQGRPAMRAEVEQSIVSGLPFLREAAQVGTEHDEEALQKLVRAATRFLPRK